MGVEIELSGTNFDKIQWRKELGNFAYAEKELRVSPLTVMLLDQEEPDLILYDDEPESEPTADASVWIHPAGGIRGVTVKNSERGIILSMPTGTGKRDWELATAMTETGIKLGATIRVDDEPAPGSPLDLSAPEQELWQLFVTHFAQAAEQSDSGVVTLPVLYGMLHIDLTTAEVSSPDLHDKLVEKMQRYTEAHWASNMVIEKPDKGQLTVNIAGGVPTVVSMESDGIILLDEPSSPSDDSAPLFGGEPISPEKFVEIMSDHVEVLGSLCYVPLFKYSDHPDIMKKLDPRAPSTMPGGGPLPTAIKNEQAARTGSPSSGSAGGRQSLAHGPVLVFLLIAAADGEVDRKEAEAFGKILASNEFATTPLLRSTLAETLNQFQPLMESMLTGGKPPQLLMVEFLQALDSYSEQESKPVRLALYGIGHAVASASGGFLGFGSKISKEEGVALDGLRMMLGLSSDEV
ncbi:MAG: hypothetical protein AB8F34_03905 [Akkermansiaceae bacterium]